MEASRPCANAHAGPRAHAPCRPPGHAPMRMLIPELCPLADVVPAPDNVASKVVRQGLSAGVALLSALGLLLLLLPGGYGLITEGNPALFGRWWRRTSARAAMSAVQGLLATMAVNARPAAAGTAGVEKPHVVGWLVPGWRDPRPDPVLGKPERESPAGARLPNGFEHLGVVLAPEANYRLVLEFEWR